MSKSLKGLYDDGRALTVGPGINAEVDLTIGNQEPLFLFAQPFLAIALDATRDSLLAAPELKAVDVLDCRLCYRLMLDEQQLVVHVAECPNHGRY